MARVQVRGRGHPGEGYEVTRADRPLAFKATPGCRPGWGPGKEYEDEQQH
jgi:hypothetical protein